MVLMDKSFTMTLRTQNRPLPFESRWKGPQHGQDPFLTTVAQGSHTPFSPATQTASKPPSQPALHIFVQPRIMHDIFKHEYPRIQSIGFNGRCLAIVCLACFFAATPTTTVLVVQCLSEKSVPKQSPSHFALSHHYHAS